MFLAQEYSIAAIPGDSDPAVEVGCDDSICQNVAVFQEIENVLEDYPKRSYRAAFSGGGLRQKLVARVLRYLPYIYSIMGNGKEPITDAHVPYRSKAERLPLDVLIRGSNFHLFGENTESVSCHIHQNNNSSNNSLESPEHEAVENQ